MLDEAWLRERGYAIVGDRAVRMPVEVSESGQEATIPPGGYLSTPLPADTPERVLLAEICRIAKQYSWTFYHTHRSDRSPKGFPDLVLVRPGPEGASGRLLFVEAKTATGKLTPEQVTWLSLLRHSVPGVETFVWRPRHLAEIHEILK